MNTLFNTDKHKWIKTLDPFLSAETGYLHIDTGSKGYKKGDSIPLYYNLLYLLSLFRMKERASIEKAIKNLDHLLYFQTAQGAFPVHLHHYPFCDRKFETLSILYPLYWIYIEFASVLPKALKERVEVALKEGFGFIRQLEPDKEYSYLLTLEKASISLALGILFGNREWKDEGRQQLKQLAKRGPQSIWGSPRSLSKILMALELNPNECVENEWNLFWSYLKETWFEKGSSYMGPSLSEYFEADQEEQTAYHLYMNDETKLNQLKVTPKAVLEYALIEKKQAYQDSLCSSIQYLESYEWGVTREENFAVSFFNLSLTNWVKTGGYYPLKIVMPNSKQTDSFILQMGTPMQIKKINQTTYDLYVEPPQEEEELDLCFFWNLSSKASALVDEKRASMFDLNQKVEIKFKTLRLVITFPEPSQYVWGQFLQRNRRTQTLEDQYEIFDHHLYFRLTQKLERPLQMRVEVFPI